MAYAPNAGKCPKCGNLKTWGFRVLNPTSGKMMPGHVTIDGFKINDGMCPFYAKSSAGRDVNAGVTAMPGTVHLASTVRGVQVPAPGERLARDGQGEKPDGKIDAPGSTPAPRTPVMTVKNRDGIEISMHGAKASLTPIAAIRLCKDILELIGY